MADFFGGSGDDTRSGTSDDDRFVLAEGNDTAYGGAGNDSFAGGSGNDSLIGGPGDDIIGTGSGNDRAQGGTGRDTLYGGTGRDTLFGQDGLDYIYGGTGNDLLYGGDGYDLMYGGDGNDEFFANTSTNAGDGDIDAAYGGSGNDRYQGDADGDQFYGGSGRDVFFGYGGGDYVDPLSVEEIYGGDGNDTLYLRETAATGEPITLDFRTTDATMGSHSSSWVSFERVDADFGITADFTVIGDGVASFIRTASGDDRIYGGTGSQTIYGNNGNDILNGGAGDDVMYGGNGNDRYYVGSAGDQVLGEGTYSSGGGIDTVFSWVTYTAPENIELVRLQGSQDLNATGNDAPGTLVGNSGGNTLTGRGGDDQLNGLDGDDRFVGGVGRDVSVGGAGADTFVYTHISDSRAGAEERDIINGFERGTDIIDLSLMDSNPFYSGNQEWDWIGTSRFDGDGASSAGQLRLQNLGGPNAVLVEGDYNGDGEADFQIFVNLTRVLGEDDFIL